MRTLVYIDGLNLYYGCLKPNPHCRWLNVEKLAIRLCREAKPESDIIGIKYFNAPIITGLAKRGQVTMRALSNYLRALEYHCSNVTVIMGKHQKNIRDCYLNEKPINFDVTYNVVTPEEKQTDVNVAIHMLADATDNACDQQVLISNDSDYAPVLEMLKYRHPEIVQGVIPPLLPLKKGFPRTREPSKDVLAFADWNRYPIDVSILEDCQLPPSIPGKRNKTIFIPKHWQSTSTD